MKTVLVTGGAGFIGSSLAVELVKKKYRVVVLDNFSNGQLANLRSYQKTITVIKADVRNLAALKKNLASHRPDIIFHLAAIHYIPYCIAHPKEAVAVNVGGTENLLKAIAAGGLKPLVVLASSAAVYRDSRSALRESSSIGPMDIYGETKVRAERLVRKSAAKLGHPFILARLFNVYGPRDGTPHVIPRIIEQIKRQGRIELGNMTPKRDFIHVADMAAALAKLARFSPAAGQVYNIGTGREYSVRQTCDFVIAALKQSGRHKPIQVTSVQSAVRKSDRLHLLSNSNKIKTQLNWRPKIGFQQGLVDLLKFEKVL